MYSYLYAGHNLRMHTSARTSTFMTNVAEDSMLCRIPTHALDLDQAEVLRLLFYHHIQLTLCIATQQ